MNEFVKLLKRLSLNNEVVTIIIRSGEDCCEHTGCIGDVVDDSFLVLITSIDDTCDRTYIPIDCICAVIDPAING